MMWPLTIPRERKLSTRRTIIFYVSISIALGLIIAWSLGASCSFSSPRMNYSCAEVRYGKESLVQMQGSPFKLTINESIIDQGQIVGPCNKIYVSYKNYIETGRVYTPNVVTYVCGEGKDARMYSYEGDTKGQQYNFTFNKINEFGVRRNYTSLENSIYHVILSEAIVSLQVDLYNNGSKVNFYSTEPGNEELKDWVDEYRYLIGNNTLVTTFNCTNCYDPLSTFTFQAFLKLAVNVFSLLTPAYAALKLAVAYGLDYDSCKSEEEEDTRFPAEKEYAT